MSHPAYRFVRQIRRLPLLVALLFSPCTFADESPLESLLVGVSYITQDKPYPGIRSGDKNLIAPIVRWDWNNFFVDGLYGNEALGGFRFYDYRGIEVSVIGRYNTMGYDAGDSLDLILMADRDPAFEAGLEARWRPSRWGVRAQVLADVTSEHEGQEARAELTWEAENLGWKAEYALGVIWQSEDMVDYYFGVEANEAIPLIRPAYAPDAEFSARGAGTLTFDLFWPITFVLHADFRWFGDEIDDSPIVTENTQWTLGGGVTYRFGQTSRPRQRGYRR